MSEKSRSGLGSEVVAEKKRDCIYMIHQLFDAYKDNDYVLQRIYCHIVQNIPITLENEAKNYERRQNQNNYLSEEQQIFIEIFLSKHNYYYLPNHNCFYEYNGKDYLIVKEDDIIHELLSAISKDRILMQWKHKTKFNVLRKIKERILYQSTPESATIQEVLNTLYPAIFHSKSMAKYFLTIVGDNILKKNNARDTFFLVSPKLKQLVTELEKVAALSIGNSSITNSFITKYHETHSYENIRLVKQNENYSSDYWRLMLKKVGLNLLCVAVHYSNRYKSSDAFLDEKADEECKQYAYTLKNSTQHQMIRMFIKECLVFKSDEYCIEWKQLHFIWKQFLSSHDIPNILFSTTLKANLIEMIEYDKEKDMFIGLTSKYLPGYQEFIEFWETTIDMSSNASHFENEFEIDEICSLFNHWAKNKTYLSEDTILKIVKHAFPFPMVDIVEDKYLLNIKCSLWDKVADLHAFLDYFEEKKKDYSHMISFDEMYHMYQHYCNLKQLKNIVSKRYFEKYIAYQMEDSIIYDKFIRTESPLLES